jgi:hypothetical protein
MRGEAVQEALQAFCGNEAALERRQELCSQVFLVPFAASPGFDKAFLLK